MLVELLHLIATGQVHSLSDLAQRLQVSEPLATQMLERLAHQGYLSTPELCSGGCTGCAQHAACGLKPSLRLWTLTKKGYAAL